MPRRPEPLAFVTTNVDDTRRLLGHALLFPGPGQQRAYKQKPAQLCSSRREVDKQCLYSNLASALPPLGLQYALLDEFVECGLVNSPAAVVVPRHAHVHLVEFPNDEC